ncbi:kunitz-type protease inhibitor 1-like isoform X2 [Polyodon spathula]|uniref:kunitz-type protease inhibitor 1-like isoform X2 n=1 Tax=Polyodon spathula TaxID=7913 RepID=UPI001B7F27C2|nr:kunitz-type protease inhibitor 1-like isoform X2 [Polyodon spathula]
MSANWVGVFLPLLFASLLSQTRVQAQSFGEECVAKFTLGKPDFILDTDDSVKDGATFLASPNISHWRECVLACCMQPRCNLAFMEETDLNCFLFDCLYKQSYVCRFIKKTGYVNYLLSSVSKEYLEGRNLKPDSDKPPSALATLDRVVQPLETVTLAGIESKDDHGIVSYKWDLLQGNPTVQWQKTDLDDQVVVSNLNEGTYIFQLTVTDTVGQTDSANVTILVLTKEQSEAASAHSSRSVFPLNKCNTECSSSQFKCGDGCCLDSGLECDGQTQCSDGSDEASCTNIKNKFGRLLDIDIPKEKVRCTEPPMTGPCRASHLRWYYDPYSTQCQRFTFGGCTGNNNNFKNDEECSAACAGVTQADVFARGQFERQESGGSNSGPIAVAVLLGVSIAIVLAVLGYCYLKNRKAHPRRQAVAVNNGSSTLSTAEDTHRLVYNSTTKPLH